MKLKLFATRLTKPFGMVVVVVRAQTKDIAENIVKMKYFGEEWKLGGTTELTQTGKVGIVVEGGMFE